MNVSEKLTKLRSLMLQNNIDAYIVPSGDYHQSESVSEYFKCREYITGFTGSSGTAVITHDAAGLWTDGRYFIQAEKQLSGSGITLYRMGEPHVPTIEEYLETVLPSHGALGFDGKVLAMKKGTAYATEFFSKHISIAYRQDLIDMIWNDRPSMKAEPVFLLEEKYTGETTASKLSRLRAEMQNMHATSHIIASLDDIAWLLNIRGNDNKYSPLVLCFAIITMSQVDLFIDKTRLNGKVLAAFAENHIVLHPYHKIYEFVAELSCNETVLIDPERINYTLYNSIPDRVKKIEKENPTILWKAIKNETEIENIKKAHLKDGIAHTKFMHWLKTIFDSETITELSASDKLVRLRAEQEGFLWPSFAPICAYGSNAAMCHYSSSKETDRELKSGSLFLTDTGANYYEGSTDITRTIAIGEINNELKLHFTTVVRSMINLAKAKFLYGCSGYNLDTLARQPIWELELNYNHGTGHGVGYLLNIHEDPCTFNWRIKEHLPHQLEAGMIITDEPGIYIENSHGIRIENELLVCKGPENDYGQFMHFETITYVPIDLDAICPELLMEDEKIFLNNYHKLVYRMISPHLSEQEKEWLRHYTREI